MTAAFLIALRSKGETVSELTALVDVMLEFATPITIPGPTVDVVGSTPIFDPENSRIRS